MSPGVAAGVGVWTTKCLFLSLSLTWAHKKMQLWGVTIFFPLKISACLSGRLLGPWELVGCCFEYRSKHWRHQGNSPPCGLVLAPPRHKCLLLSLLSSLDSSSGFTSCWTDTQTPHAIHSPQWADVTGLVDEVHSKNLSSQDTPEMQEEVVRTLEMNRNLAPI